MGRTIGAPARSGAPLFDLAETYADRAAVVGAGRVNSYADLLEASHSGAAELLGGREDLQGARVAYLLAPGFEHVAWQWSIWRAGGVAVPLAVSHPQREHTRVVADVRPERVLVSADLAARLDPAGLDADVTVVGKPEGGSTEPLPGIDPDRAAMILFTSGTTGVPKGVVSTHAALTAQMDALHAAWGWSPDDRILHVLPLHHVHGIVNCLCCALRAGACVEFHAHTDLAGIWDRLADGEISVFMAVPTIYYRLLGVWDDADPSTKRRWALGARSLRLTVSGSAALPRPLFDRWRDVTGHVLLERYGMTEIGMALSNPLKGERRAQTVGHPLPGVRVRLVDPEGRAVQDGSPGEIEVTGPQVFRQYWERPDATRVAFRDGWFRTGDDGVVEDGYYRILGRRSVDILKSGGYKISALEIETLLLEHPRIAECAVVGLPDPEFGQVVAAAVVPRPEASPDSEDLRAWCRERMASYKVPRRWVRVDTLPRNAMGKVVKPEVADLFTPP